MTLFLIHWWSDRYKRPMKDELLSRYTFEELLYEYYSIIERENVSIERIKEESDKIEGEKQKAAEAWADEEEQKEIELSKAKAIKNKEEKEQSASKTTTDKDDIEWMQRYVDQHKDELGDNFGSDIDMNFNDIGKE